MNSVAFSRLRWRLPLSYAKIKNNRFMSQASENMDPSIRKIKFRKRIFSTILYGSTLLAALIVSRQRRKKNQLAFEDAKRLPLDDNFKSSWEIYEYKGHYNLHVANLRCLNDAREFKARPEDIFVCSYPKAGITWVQEIVFLLGTNLDFNRSNNQLLETRFPYLEYSFPGIKSVEKTPSPRFIKTHMPYPLLPESVFENDCKVIYVMRNPKDVVVSYYYFMRMNNLFSYVGTMSEFIDKFIKEELPYSPFWDHAKQYIQNEMNLNNVLIVNYEDLQKDLLGEIKRIAAFMGKSYSDEQFRLIENHCTFTEMASNPTTNYSHWDYLGIRKKTEAPFMRKGISGGWRFELSENDIRKLDKFILDKSTAFPINFSYD